MKNHNYYKKILNKEKKIEPPTAKVLYLYCLSSYRFWCLNGMEFCQKSIDKMTQGHIQGGGAVMDMPLPAKFEGGASAPIMKVNTFILPIIWVHTFIMGKMKVCTLFIPVQRLRVTTFCSYFLFESPAEGGGELTPPISKPLSVAAFQDNELIVPLQVSESTFICLNRTRKRFDYYDLQP